MIIPTTNGYRQIFFFNRRWPYQPPMTILIADYRILLCEIGVPATLDRIGYNNGSS